MSISTYLLRYSRMLDPYWPNINPIFASVRVHPMQCKAFDVNSASPQLVGNPYRTGVPCRVLGRIDTKHCRCLTRLFGCYWEKYV